MKYYTLITILFLGFGFTGTMSSCNKSTCPTYATSGPTKTAKKKGNAPYSKSYSSKQKKTKQGKPMSGL